MHSSAEQTCVNRSTIRSRMLPYYIPCFDSWHETRGYLQPVYIDLYLHRNPYGTESKLGIKNHHLKK